MEDGASNLMALFFCLHIACVAVAWLWWYRVQRFLSIEKHGVSPSTTALTRIAISIKDGPRSWFFLLRSEGVMMVQGCCPFSSQNVFNTFAMLFMLVNLSFVTPFHATCSCLQFFCYAHHNMSSICNASYPSNATTFPSLDPFTAQTPQPPPHSPTPLSNPSPPTPSPHPPPIPAHSH